MFGIATPVEVFLNESATRAHHFSRLRRTVVGHAGTAMVGAVSSGGSRA
jgi:hypothetical protein